MQRSHTFRHLILVSGLAAACGDTSSTPPPSSSSTGRSTTDPISSAEAGDTRGASGAGPDASGPTDATGADTGSTGGSTEVEPGPDTRVPTFDGAHVFFSGWEEGQNLREIDIEVEFPAAELGYASVELEFGLRCPDGACDWWDRKGHLAIVENAGTDDEQVLEVARFVTPYRVEGQWKVDVTALRPLLSGHRTLRAFIDTWVGPGHANGNGWLVDAAFEFVGGVPADMPVEIVPLWPVQDLTIGDPAMPPDAIASPATATIPADASRVELYSVITGHGQGNASNCAEFCQLMHGYMVGDDVVQRSIWRDDCDTNPINNQQGTWQYPRAGWCPGDVVTAWVEDVTNSVVPGEDVVVAYDLEDYENTCRPDAPVCTGCALGNDCEYNDSNHTAPSIRMSALLVIYAATGSPR